MPLKSELTKIRRSQKCNKSQINWINIPHFRSHFSAFLLLVCFGFCVGVKFCIHVQILFIPADRFPFLTKCFSFFHPMSQWFELMLKFMKSSSLKTKRSCLSSEGTDRDPITPGLHVGCATLFHHYYYSLMTFSCFHFAARQSISAQRWGDGQYLQPAGLFA